MARSGVQLRVLGLERAEGGGGFVVPANGGAEAREEGSEDGVFGGGHGGGGGGETGGRGLVTVGRIE